MVVSWLPHRSAVFALAAFVDLRQVHPLITFDVLSASCVIVTIKDLIMGSESQRNAMPNHTEDYGQLFGPIGNAITYKCKRRYAHHALSFLFVRSFVRSQFEFTLLSPTNPHQLVSI